MRLAFLGIFVLLVAVVAAFPVEDECMIEGDELNFTEIKDYCLVDRTNPLAFSTIQQALDDCPYTYIFVRGNGASYEEKLFLETGEDREPLRIVGCQRPVIVGEGHILSGGHSIAGFVFETEK